MYHDLYNLTHRKRSPSPKGRVINNNLPYQKGSLLWKKS